MERVTRDEPYRQAPTSHWESRPRAELQYELHPQAFFLIFFYFREAYQDILGRRVSAFFSGIHGVLGSWYASGHSRGTHTIRSIWSRRASFHHFLYLYFDNRHERQFCDFDFFYDYSIRPHTPYAHRAFTLHIRRRQVWKSRIYDLFSFPKSELSIILSIVSFPVQPRQVSPAGPSKIELKNEYYFFTLKEKVKKKNWICYVHRLSTHVLPVSGPADLSDLPTRSKNPVIGPPRGFRPTRIVHPCTPARSLARSGCGPRLCTRVRLTRIALYGKSRQSAKITKPHKLTAVKCRSTDGFQRSAAGTRGI